MEATGLTAAGEGVARLDGLVVFVHGLLPGEKALVRIKESGKRFGRAELEKLRLPSAQRTRIGCAGHGLCGGCPWSHLNYEAQLQWKRQIVADTLQRIGKLNPGLVRPVIGMADPRGYRNKLRVRTSCRGGRWTLGLLEARTQKVVPVEECLLVNSRINILMSSVRRGLQELSARAVVPESLTFRAGTATGQLMVSAEPGWGSAGSAVKTALRSRYPGWRIGFIEADTLLLNPPGVEEDFVEIVRGFRFRVGPHSFFQVNTVQAGTLVDLVREYLGRDKISHVFDIYCGVGLFSIAVAGTAGAVTGVECDERAVTLARENAVLNGIFNARFVSSRAEDYLTSDEALNAGVEAVIVDPPRSGLSPRVREALIDLKPRQMVYVSCDPATLARDLGDFSRSGYTVTCVQPVDMFPHTGHVECVASLLKA